MGDTKPERKKRQLERAVLDLAIARLRLNTLPPRIRASVEELLDAATTNLLEHQEAHPALYPKMKVVE